MKKTLKTLAAAVLAGTMVASMAFCASAAENLTFGTGGTTGTYYAVGGVMATVLNPILQESQLTVTATGASKANIQEIEDGGVDLALVQNDVMFYAYTGTDLFSDEDAYDSFRTIATIFDETVQIVTCNPEIKSVADLKGKAVSVGDAGSGTEFNARQILSAYDLTFDDITVVNLGFGDSADSLKDGKIDAAFIVAGAPTTAVVDLATMKDINLVQLDEEHIAKLQEDYSFYSETIIEAGTYKGLEEDATTVSVRATLICFTDLPEDMIYELTKALFENQAQLAEGHSKFELLNLEEAVKGVFVPFHPGAARYYEEQGITIE